MDLPRHFVARGTVAQPQPGFALRHALDVLAWTAGPRNAANVLVGMDATTALRLSDAQQLAGLPPPVREALSHHELSGGGRPWPLQAQQLFVLSLQQLEQPLQTPGLNDPVHLHGVLHGPFESPATSLAPSVAGYLTVTRADVLSALVQGAAHAFQLPHQGKTARCFHMLLPGGSDEDTVQGRALVLCYPMMPAELGLEDVANELLTAQLLHDLLGSIQADVRAEKQDHPLANTVLPCPSRALLSSELQAQGYVVKGDTATRKGGGGVLKSVFGMLMGDKVTLPPQGSVEDFLELARAALGSFPNWPNPRARALAQHLGLRSVSPPVPRAVTAAAWPPGAPQVLTAPVDWKADFQPASPTRSHVTSARSVVAPPPPPTVPQKKAADKPWMDDFSAGAPKKPQTEKAAPPAGKPDWLKDFE